MVQQVIEYTIKKMSKREYVFELEATLRDASDSRCVALSLFQFPIAGRISNYLRHTHATIYNNLTVLRLMCNCIYCNSLKTSISRTQDKRIRNQRDQKSSNSNMNTKRTPCADCDGSFRLILFFRVLSFFRFVILRLFFFGCLYICKKRSMRCMSFVCGIIHCALIAWNMVDICVRASKLSHLFTSFLTRRIWEELY